MRKSFEIAIVGILLVVAFTAGLFLFKLYSEGRKLARFGEEYAEYEQKATIIAKEWIKENAWTYRYDGARLSLEGFSFCSTTPKGCQEVFFKFESAHGGYGNRTGSIVLQVITLHTIVVKVENGQVTSAITDEKFDEITQKLIANSTPPQKMGVKIYFANTEKDPQVSCDKVFPVTRTIEATDTPARRAIEELLKGPTPAELKDAYLTTIPSGVVVQNIVIVSSTASIDFNAKLDEGVGGSCRVTTIRKQIVETLKQFTTVTDVEISINGRTEDILQP